MDESNGAKEVPYPRAKRCKPVRTLEQICRDKYLNLLQDVCAGYVHLMQFKSGLLRHVHDNILWTLKAQLKNNLSGTLSTVLRQEMIDTVLSGKFPTEEFQNTYEENSAEELPDEYQVILSEIKKCGRNCVSVCCTGAFIIETMLAVLVNPDVRCLRFEAPISKTYLSRGRFLRKHVPIQVPSVLAHFESSLNNVKAVKLERFIVKNTHIVAGVVAHAKNQSVDVLSKFKSSLPYLEIPGRLSAASARVPEYGLQYLGISEHLMLIISNVFRGLNRFEKMTKVVLGAEACNTMLGMKSDSGRDVSVDLFKHMGKSCPNLKILDLTQAIGISGDALVHLFFHDAYTILHQFVYQPHWEVQGELDLVQLVAPGPLDEVRKHDLTKYCPWCMDQWCANGIRGGLEFVDYRTPIIDDRLYHAIEKSHPEKAKHYLINVLKISDLVKAVDTPWLKLIRPKPRPWEEGFVPPAGKKRYKDGRDDSPPWYMPDSVSFRPWKKYPYLNKINKSLQFLKLSQDNFHSNHELIPFLLKVMPNVKSLGYARVVDGLKMIRDNPELTGAGIRGDQLENLDYDFDWSFMCNYDSSWAAEEIRQEVNYACLRNMDGYIGDDSFKKQLTDELNLIGQHCPNLKTLSLNFPVAGPVKFLKAENTELWSSLGSRLMYLRELTITAGCCYQMMSLVEVLGPRLSKLNLALFRRTDLDDATIGSDDDDIQEEDEPQVPKLDALLDCLPNVEDLQLSFGSENVDVSSEAENADKKFDKNLKLKTFSVYTAMTKRALTHFWSRAIHLESIYITTPVFKLAGDNSFDDWDDFTEIEMANLLKLNRMRNLRTSRVAFPAKNVESARLLIEGLSHVPDISDLLVTVRLPQETYHSEEHLNAALTQTVKIMKKFKDFCIQKSVTGCRVRWKWNKSGVLEFMDHPELLETTCSDDDDDESEDF